MKVILIICWLTIFFNAKLWAQEDKLMNLSPVSTFNMFRESSYISVLGGAGNIEPLIFEADIIPYYMLSINRNAKWGIELSPRIILRMYNKDSYPVRTPSYMPRATFFYQVAGANDAKKDWISYFSWYHHSNGQDGAFYNTDSVSINCLNGSFSTNFLELGLFFSEPDKKRSFIMNYHKLSVSYAYSLDDEIKSRYGRLRFLFDNQSSFDLSGMLRIFNQNCSNQMHKPYLIQGLRIGWLAGQMNHTNTFDWNRLNVRYTLSYKPSFLNDINFFVQYYYGQDYYNIYFYRNLHVFRFGIAAKALSFN